MSRRRISTTITTTIAALGLTALAAAGCASAEDTAGDDPAPASPSPTASESPGESPEPSENPDEEAEEAVLEITVADGQVTPNGERVEIGVGEQVLLQIDSDVPGQLHAHATTEQEVNFEAGESEHTMMFEQPGVVDLELHDPARVVAQFEIR